MGSGGIKHFFVASCLRFVYLYDMADITVELTVEMATQMLPLWELQREQKAQELSELTSKINKIKDTLSRVGHNGQTLLALDPSPDTHTKTPTGRHKKGVSRKIVANYLKRRKDEGVNIKEISLDTNTVYGTTRRALKELAKSGSAVRGEDGLWRWGAFIAAEEAAQKRE
jgi:predicted transcriptional regulator